MVGVKKKAKIVFLHSLFVHDGMIFSMIFDKIFVQASFRDLFPLKIS